MKRIILFIVIAFLSSCTTKRSEDLKYKIYSTVIDNYFNKSKLTSDSIFIVLNDSIADFRNEMGELIYSVENNDSFFVEYCKGDTSFKSFILSVKSVDSKVVPLLSDKIKSKPNFIIKTKREFKKIDLPYSYIHFSNVVFNKEFDKAILFVSGGGSGSWYFLRYNKDGWTIDNKIMSWVV